MSQLTLNSYVSPIVAATLFLFIGCTGGPQDHSGADASGFEKPTKFEIPDRDFNDFDLFEKTNSYSTEAFNPGEVSLLKGREHMSPDENHQQFWINSEQPFVLDLTYKMWGYDLDNYNLVVLANFEPVDFLMKTAGGDEKFPSVKELSDSASNTSSCVPLEFTEKKTTGVSIYIPPSSFDRKGAFDIRVLLMPKHEPSEKEWVALRGGAAIHHSVTLYREGVNFPVDRYESIGGTEVKGRSIGSKLALGQPSPTSAFLLPPKDVRNLEKLEFPFNDARLGQEFTVSNEQISLRGLSFQSNHLREDESMILAFDGCRPLPNPKGIIRPPKLPNDPVNTSEEFVVHFPVNVQFDPTENKKLRLVKLVSPFQDMLGLRGPSDLKVDISNTIFLRRQ